MGEKRLKQKRAAVRLPALMACCMGLVSPALSLLMALGPFSGSCDRGPAIGECEAAQSEELFSVDVGKQKEAIAKELDRIDEILYSQAKLQESRGAIDVLEHKIDRIRKSLTKEEFDAFHLRLEKQRKAIPFKEDSLTNKTMEILHGQGVEASLQFTQNDLRQHGVSDQKIASVEKRILEEAPAIKQAQERQQIARALSILQSGQLPDSSFDPYIVRTAQLIMKAHDDSMQRIEDAKKKKELEEQERLERAKMEKEMKEKKLEDERLAKQRKEEEKKNALEQAAERKRLAAEEKEKQRQARVEEELQKKALAALKDSIAQAQKKQARIAQQTTIAEQQRISQQRAQQLKDQQDKTYNDSIEQQRAQQAAIVEQQKISQQRAQQLKAQQDKARNDSIEQQRAQQVVMVEQQRISQQRAQQEKAKNDNIARQQKSQPVVTATQSSKQQPEAAMTLASAAPLQGPAEAQPQKSVIAQSVAPTAEAEQNRPIDKTAQAYLQSLKDKQKEAQKKVMDIYDLIEQKQGKAALDIFKQERSFIGTYVEAQVFNVLEQTVLQSVMESPGSAALVAGEEAASAQSSKKASPEQQRYDLINGYLRDNKVDAAYAEFKRSEKQLKNAMAKEEFKQLKNMVENAYKTRHSGK